MRTSFEKGPKLRGGSRKVKRWRLLLFLEVHGSGAAAMQLRMLVLAAALTLAACGQTISGINARPDKHYQKKVTFSGRVARTQVLPTTTLLEIADRRGGRMLVASDGPVEVGPGDWVKVGGILVPEIQIGEVVLYDVVRAEHVRRARAPRMPEIM
jgi:hypothetical protein